VKSAVLPTSGSSARLSGLGDNQAVTAVRQRRMTIPERPNYSLNLWSIMKNCIGKDLSKIPMPVSLANMVCCSAFEWYGDDVGDTVEENSSIFFLIQMCWLPLARACGSETAQTTSPFWSIL